MKRFALFALALGGLVLAAAPAQAGQISDIIHDFENHCSLSTLSCSVSHDGTRTEQLPDGTKKVYISGGSKSEGPTTFTSPKCGAFETLENGILCVGHSAQYKSFWSPAGSVKTVKVPGGTVTVATCTTKTGQLTHSGHNPFSGWDVSVTTSTSDGACP